MRESSAAKELYPDPSGELEQQEAEKAANDHSEKEPDLTQPGAVEQQLQAAFESKKGQEYLKKLDQWAENPDAFHGIGKILSYFDTCLPMRKFRAWWDQRDHLTQFALMYGTTPPQMWIQQAGPIQALIKVGFLKYKGHNQENQEKMEAQIDKMGGMGDYLAKYGIKFGKYIFPELEAVEPLVEPLLKLKGAGNKALRNVRRSVYYHRAKYEQEQLKPVDVVVTTNVQSNGAVDHPSDEFRPAA